MLQAITERLRVPLTRPQALPETSAVLWWPEDVQGKTDRPTDRPGVVLGHGAGTDMTSSLLRGVGRGLAMRGYPVMVFNFAYAEAGRKAPDPGPRLESAYRDALAVARARMGSRPLVIGGRSMGGRMASHLAAQGEACAGLLLLAYPLHPSGVRADERLRSAHWPQLRVPVLFVQGDRDSLCDLALLERERLARLRNTSSRVEVIPGADHGFAVRKSDARDEAEVHEEVIAASARWLEDLPVSVCEGPAA